VPCEEVDTGADGQVIRNSIADYAFIIG